MKWNQQPKIPPLTHYFHLKQALHTKNRYEKKKYININRLSIEHKHWQQSRALNFLTIFHFQNWKCYTQINFVHRLEHIINLYIVVMFVCCCFFPLITCHRLDLSSFTFWFKCKPNNLLRETLIRTIRIKIHTASDWCVFLWLL